MSEQIDRQKHLVKSWMRHSHLEHVDGRTGELNLTTLAEAAAQKFHLYENDPDATIPEWVFELSLEVADELGLAGP